MRTFEISRGRFIVAMLAMALFTTACGDDSEEVESASSTTSAPTTTTVVTLVPPTTTVVPTTTEPAVDPNEWIAELRRARAVAEAAFFEQFERMGDPTSPGWGTVAFEIEDAELSAAVQGEFLLALADPPIEVAVEAEEWATLVQNAIDRSLELAAGFAGLGYPLDTLLRDIPSEEISALYGPDDGPSFVMLEACFALSEAAVEAGFDLLDCAGSEEGPDGGGDDPVEPGPLGPGRYEVTAPGRYEFDLARPFAIQLDEPTTVAVSDTEVQILVDGAGSAPNFHVVAIDEVIEPEALLDNGGGRGWSFDRMVSADDLAGWFDQLPFEIETGVSSVGAIEAPYWRLLDVEYTGGELPLYAWAPSSLDAAHLITPGSVFWEISHPDGGSLVVYANRVVEAPDDPSSLERLAIGEDLLGKIELP